MKNSTSKEFRIHKMVTPKNSNVFASVDLKFKQDDSPGNSAYKIKKFLNLNSTPKLSALGKEDKLERTQGKFQRLFPSINAKELEKG